MASGRSRRASLGTLVMLYGGKAAGIVVAFVFLPLYSRLLGTQQFGIVAVLLSLQALLLTLQLGMSTLLSRDIATGTGQPARLIAVSERILTAAYVAILLVAVTLGATGRLPTINAATAFGIALLFWLLVLQNLYYFALTAGGDRAGASALQIAGVGLRAGMTAVALLHIEANVQVFVCVQLLGAALHTLATRLRCLAHFRPSDSGRPEETSMRPAVLALLRRSRSLALFSIAGAAVTQLDKPLIAMFISSASAAPYFLATTVCMTPISLLAGPISQYFQPGLLNSIGRSDEAQAERLLRRFTLSLVLAVGIPGLIFWFLCGPAIDLWLGAGSLSDAVSGYVRILLPGFMVGALGFVPYTLLLHAEDFRFQARLSTALTVITLTAAAILASLHSVTGVCVVYAVYHASSTLSSWIRAWRLPATTAAAVVASTQALRAGTMLLAVGILSFLIVR
jgi:O-antigen/teichoic acid export membrane protein